MSAITPDAPTPDARTLGRRLADVQARIPLLQLGALAAVFVLGAATLDGLTQWSSIKLMLVPAVLVALAAQGQTLLILMGGFDMSVPGMIVAGTMVVVLPPKFGIPFLPAVLILCAFGATLGMIAGQICHRLQLNPLIVTLATGAIALGACQVITSGQVDPDAFAPSWLTKISSPASSTFGVPVPPVVLIALAVVLLLALFLHRTPAGRRLLATGANMRSAEYSLIDTRRIWTATFAFSAIVSVLAGVLLAGYSGGVNLGLGDPYLFLGVTAVFVGGTVFGGPGDFTRTAIGALFLQLLTTVLVGYGFDPADRQILYGLVLLVAIAFYGRGAQLRDRV